jgi:nitroimidazol reductase NimA-like FMN-containing flavoprotein (pyridoxamine 5'-phosphate oxidase superfamily)
MLGELSTTEIEKILERALVGRIGCVANGKPYVVPVTYAYYAGAVYVYSVEGMKVRAMRASPEVCFQVDEIDDLTNWRSVIAWGRFEELAGADADEALHRLVDRLMPVVTSETARPKAAPAKAETPVSRPTVVYRIVLREKTGRFERG